MHTRLQGLYGEECEDCKEDQEQLNLALNPRFKNLLKTVETAIKKLHKNGSYKPDQLLSEPAYTSIIVDTASILDAALTDNDLSDSMRASLEEDIYYFSALRTHSELFEASRLLLDDDDKIKSFAAFNKDVAKIKKNYNENYLEAEYEFAVGSVAMAERWERFRESDKYLLQYRTAQDDRVRVSHEALHDTTLPKDDPFWDKYFPPNGWRCRCTAVQVLASRNEASDPAKALKNGEKSTYQEGKSGKNKLEIFRFNAGRSKVVFPPKHPYSKVKGAPTAGSAGRNIYKERK